MMTEKQRSFYVRIWSRSVSQATLKDLIKIHDSNPELCKPDEEIDILQELYDVLGDPVRKREFFDHIKRVKESVK